MSYISRITSLKGFPNVLMGRDLGHVLDPGKVYGLSKIDGMIILQEIGDHAELKPGNRLSYTLIQGTYLLTKAEHEAELKTNG